MLIFDAVAFRREQLSHSVYILSSSSHEAAQRYAYFAYVSPGPVGFKLPDGGISLSDAIVNISRFSKLGHFVLLFSGSPLVFSDSPSNSADAEHLLRSLADICLGKHDVKNFLTHTGYVIWTQNVASLDLSNSTYLSLTRSLIHGHWMLSDKIPSVIMRFKDRPLTLIPGQGDSALVYFDDNNILIGVDKGYPSLQYGTPTTPVVVMYNVNFSLSLDVDISFGLLTLPGETTANFLNLPIGFSYTLLPSDSLHTSEGLVSSNMFYPLWDTSAVCDDGMLAVLVFDPVAQTGSLTHTGTSAGYPSGYRDVWGRILTLSAPMGFSFEYTLYPTIDGGYYFAPQCNVVPSYAGLSSNQSIQMVCGLSGNEFISIPNGGSITFQAGQPALINMIAPAVGMSLPTFQLYSGAAPCPYQTSMVILVPPANAPMGYWVQSQQAPLFDASDASSQVWDLVEIGDISLATSTGLVPLLPYNAVSAMASGLGSTAAGFVAFESAYLAPTRNKQLLLQGSVVFKPGMTAVTPQGIYVQTDSENTITVSVGPPSASAFSISGSTAGWATQLFEALTTPQTFIVISSLPAGQPANNSVSATISMDGWAFDIKLPTNTQVGFGEPIVILKAGGASLAQMVSTPANWSFPSTFNVNDFDPQHTQLSAYLSSVINDARTLYNDGEGVAAYGDFVALADDPQWNGFLILNAPVDVQKCAPNVIPFLIGIDPAASPSAAYLGITSARMGSIGSGCSFFGLVDYLRPGASLQDAQSGNPGYIAITNTYDLRLVYLRAQFKNASLISFDSAALLIIESLFDEQVISYSLDGDQAAGTNSIFIEGSAQIGPDGNMHYMFTAPTGCYGTFYLSSAAVDAVIISDVRAQIDTGINPPTFNFTFNGWINMRNNPAMDLLSYEAIRYRDLTLSLSYNMDTYPPQLSFKAGGPPTLLTPGEALLSTTNSPAGTKVNLYRQNSLVGQMPLQFVQLVKGRDTGKSPSDLGYLKVNPPAGLSAPELELNWYGLLLSLALGDNGATAGKGLLSAEILLCWVPGGTTDNSVSIAPYFALASSDGQPLELEIEGVIKLGAKSVAMTATSMQDDDETYSQFVLQLQGIGLTILSTTLPAGGGLTVYLGGYNDNNGNRALGWFGGLGQYAEVPVS